MLERRGKAMNENRKRIILKEIQYWRHSKLLPEQYCDFLLTLYTEGNVEEENKQMSLLPKLQLFIPAFLFFVFLVIYFTHSMLAMQMAAGIIIIGCIVWMANKHKHRYSYLSYLYFFGGALLLYLLTIKVITNVFPANTIYITIATIIHCAIWLFVGLKWRIHFFTIAGILGLIALLVII